MVDRFSKGLDNVLVHEPALLTQAIAFFQAGEFARASNLIDQQVAAGANDPRLQHLQGLIYCRQGNLEIGTNFLQRAAHADPENLIFRLMLIRALIDGGRAADALAAAVVPRGKNPDALAIWQARAEAADRANDFATAAESWQFFAEARPGDWRAWHNLGNALAAQADWQGTADALICAVAINHGDAGLRRNLAAALQHCGRMEECVAALADVIELEPGDMPTRLLRMQWLLQLSRNDEALIAADEIERVEPGLIDIALHRGRALVGLTRFADAEEAYRFVLAKAPTEVEAVHELGLLLERTNRLESLRELIDRAVAAGVNSKALAFLEAVAALREGRLDEGRTLLSAVPMEPDPVRWHRLMAKIADALGNAALAFSETEEMNRAVEGYDSWRERAARYRTAVRRLRSMFTPQWVARLPQLKPIDGRRTPVFLVGFPRSGTTLLDTFLMGHPDIAVLEELHMTGRAERIIGDFSELPTCSEATLQSARDSYFAELDQHIKPGFMGLVVDKLPLNMLAGPMFHCLFPDAQIIFAQRHPCDCVLSSFMQSFVLNDAMASFLDIADAADLYDASMSVWRMETERLPLNTRTVVYEDLVRSPTAVLQPIIEWLGLDWRDELLDHLSTAHNRGAILTPSYDQVTAPLTTRSSGRWRKYEQELGAVLPVLLPWADWLGYQRKG